MQQQQQQQNQQQDQQQQDQQQQNQQQQRQQEQQLFDNGEQYNDAVRYQQFGMNLRQAPTHALADGLDTTMLDTGHNYDLGFAGPGAIQYEIVDDDLLGASNVGTEPGAEVESSIEGETTEPQIPGNSETQEQESRDVEVSEELLELSENEEGRSNIIDNRMEQVKSLLLRCKNMKVQHNCLVCLRRLCETIHGRYGVINQHVVHIILAILKKSIEDEELISQRECLHIIRGLSLIENGRAELGTHDIVEILVRLIASEDEEVRCSALRATFNLSVVDAATRKSIVDCGALPHLIEASQHPSDGQCAAVGTLANLATETEIKRAIVCEHNGLKPLLELLRSNDTSILTHACRALFAIAANDENKLAITDANGLPLLVNCMVSVCDAVRMNATGAIANLAIHPVNKRKLVEGGVLPHLRNLAFFPNAKIQRQVARCLFALAAHSENRKAILEERCLEALVVLLNSSSTDVQVNAAGAIGNIAMTDEFKRRVVSSGALLRLIDLAASTDVRVQRQAARAIFTLTAKEFSKKKLACHPEGLHNLINLTKSTNEEIQRDAAGALANMAIGSENKDRIVELGGLLPLIELLKSKIVAVQRQSARAIFALAGNASNQLSILNANGLKPLIDLLGSKNDEVQKHAAGAIANMANRHPAEVVKFEALPKLVEIVLTHRSLEVRRQAARAVFNLTPQCNRRGQMVLTSYAGIEGEQQRVRHEMRSLFENVLSLNVHNKLYELPVQTRYRVSPNGKMRKCGPATKSLKRPTFDSESLENRGQKRSIDGSLTNALEDKNASFSSRSTKKNSVLSHDLIVSVPISDSGVSLENENGERSSVKYMDFSGHAAILSARCEHIAVEVEKKISEMSRGVQKRRKSDAEVSMMDIEEGGESNELQQKLHIVLDAKYATSRNVWLAFMEYLYTDSVRKHAQVLRTDMLVAEKLGTLSRLMDLPRLCCFCMELAPKISSRNPTFRQFTRDDKARESTWVRDMSKLLPDFSGHKKMTSSGSLPDFTDIDIYESEVTSLDLTLKNCGVNSVDTNKMRPSQDPLSRLQHVDEMSSSPKRFKINDSLHQPINASSSPSRPRFPAHKVILASRCAYFKALFGGNANWKDSATESVKFCASPKALKIFLRYLYCGLDGEVVAALSEDASVTLEVLVVANEYNLDGLQLLCENSLISQSCINESTISVLLQELDLVHAPLLRSMCLLHFLDMWKKSELSFDEYIKHGPLKYGTIVQNDEKKNMHCSTVRNNETFIKNLKEELLETGKKWGYVVPNLPTDLPTVGNTKPYHPDGEERHMEVEMKEY